MKLPLAIEFGKALSQFYWSFQNHMNRLLQQYDLTVEHARILMIISMNEGCSQQFIADQTKKTKPAITTLLDNMTSRNLIVRVPDQNDRRVNMLYLTELGKNLQVTIQDVINAEVRTLLHGISDDDLTEMVQRFNDLTQRLLEKV
ncbi:MAG: MarR family winged helix-turn-helix transcriptional regulator [Bacteroidota bacterium]